MDALVNKLNETQMAIEHVKIAKNSFDNGVNQRKQTFDQVSNLVSSILRTLEASGAKPEKMKDARAFAHQIFGSSPKNRPSLPAEANSEKPPAKRSQLQLAYVSKADAFSKLVKAVSSEPTYQPREKEFSTAGLDEKVQELNTLNRGVEDARGAWRKAIIDRNESMYTMETSMIKTAQAVKKYVRAVYGPSSAQYTLIKSLEFINPNKT